MRETLAKRAVIIVISLLAALILCPFAGRGLNLDASAAPCPSPAAWEMQNPPAQWNDLYGVWGDSPTDVFAVGERGAILHYDGTMKPWGSMTPTTSGTTETLYGIWGVSSWNIFAVGNSGTILHYDGSTWSPMVSGTTNKLTDVWGISPSNVIAVGENGIILRYDGIAWSPMASGTTAHLHGVWGRSFCDVFAVGNGGMMQHYDGIEWSPMSSGTSADLHGVCGNIDLTYATGASGTILRCPAGSTAWSSMTGPTASDLHGVWCSSYPDVFAAGSAGEVLRYDGHSWTAMIYQGSYREVALWDTWGASSSHVYTVGDDGIVVYTSVGGFGSPLPSSNTKDLMSIWGTSPSDAVAIGRHGAQLHYDGYKWSLTRMGTGLDSDIGGEKQDIWGTSSSDFFVVGMELAPVHPSVCHYTGSSVACMIFSDTGDTLLGIWGDSSCDVFAVGGRTILHYDGTNWSLMPGDEGWHLHDVWGSASCDVFAIGSGGTIIHYDGSEWIPMSSPTPYDLRGVWGSSSSDVFAVGRDGIILHYDGIEWSHMNSGTSSNLNDIWGSSPTDVYAVGTNGTIVHYDGIAWSSMSSGTTRELDGVWGTPSSDVFAVGSGGTILHYTGSSNTAPNQPANVSPANGAPGVSLTPSLRSTGFSDFDAGDTHAASQWQVRSATGDYSSPAFDSGTDSTNLTEIQVPPGALAYSTTYWWHVRHQDSRGGWSDWSCETSFTAPPPPQAEFDFTCVRVSRAVMLVFFSNLSSGGVAPLTYAWDFDSDGTVDATGREPWHRYMASGTYTASLTITDAVGNTHTETKADCITVLSPGRGKHGNGGRADQHGFRHWRLPAQWSAFRSPIARPCPPGPSWPCGG